MFCKKCRAEILSGMLKCPQCSRPLTNTELDMLSREDPFYSGNRNRNGGWGTQNWNSTTTYTGTSSGDWGNAYVPKKKKSYAALIGVIAVVLLVLILILGIGSLVTAGLMYKSFESINTVVSIPDTATSTYNGPVTPQQNTPVTPQPSNPGTSTVSSVSDDVDDDTSLVYINSVSELRNLLLEEMDAGNTTITFNTSGSDSEYYYDESVGVLDDLLSSNPELFWLNGGWTLSYTGTRSEVTFVIELDTYGNLTNLDYKRSELDKKIDEIVAMTDSSMDDYEKALFFHDYLIANCDYLDSGAQDEHNAYGCLVEGYCVCEGYTKAYMILCSRVGIECKSAYGGDHAWNYIKLGSDYTYVDVTFDDPVDPSTGKGSTYGPYYDYFCISTSELLRDHVIDPECNPPECIRLQR